MEHALFRRCLCNAHSGSLCQQTPADLTIRIVTTVITLLLLCPSSQGQVRASQPMLNLELLVQEKNRTASAKPGPGKSIVKKTKVLPATAVSIHCKTLIGRGLTLIYLLLTAILVIFMGAMKSLFILMRAMPGLVKGIRGRFRKRPPPRS